MQFNKQAKQALVYARRISRQTGQNYIGTEHLLAGLLSVTDSVAFQILSNADVTKGDVIALISQLIKGNNGVDLLDRPGFTPKMHELLDMASSAASAKGDEEIGTEHLLEALLMLHDCAGTRLLSSMNIDTKELLYELSKITGEDETFLQNASGNEPGSKTKGTPSLDKYSRDLTGLAAEGRLDPVVGRDSEIDRVIQILSRRTKNNPCLIGEPGVGKTAIAEGLAQRIADGDVPGNLSDKRLMSLDLAGIVAGTKFRGEFEDRIKKIIDETVSCGDVIIFIDEIHTLIGAGSAEGTLDASNILKPVLARGELQVIGATTITEYRKRIEKDAALERRFQKVMVEAPDRETSVKILNGLKPLYEAHHNVTISDEAIKACVDFSDRYITDRYLPDKAIDLMDESASRLRMRSVKSSDMPKLEREEAGLEDDLVQALSDGDMDRAHEIRDRQKSVEKSIENEKKRAKRGESRRKLVLTENDVALTAAQWTGIPVTRITQSEASRLKNLEKVIHRRVIGQEDAVAAVAKAVRRGRLGLKEPGRPTGSFLFLGPTGVGKTEISKALAEAVFGDENAMIRVDMSEYMEKYSVSKMIGSPPGYVGYTEGGQLSEKVRRHPYSVVLFDEIEKAHPDVFNILLQVLDDGHITDSQGRKIDFRNTIIIMTSNAGAQSIVSPSHLGFGSGDTEKQNYEQMKSGVMEEVKRIFRPEFLNRIDETVVFRQLNKEDLGQIVKLQIAPLSERAREQFGISLHVMPSALKFLVDKSFDPKYGARPLRREIQTRIMDRLSDDILNARCVSGQRVTVTVKDNDLIFKISKQGEHAKA